MNLQEYMAADRECRAIEQELDARRITAQDAVRRLVKIGWTPNQAAFWIKYR